VDTSSRLVFEGEEKLTFPIPRSAKVCWSVGCRIEGCSAMWGVFAGIGIWFAIYPFIADWLERRAARKALADMRALSKQKHPWDVLRGDWMAKR
jgi:hypothetical protein